LGQPFHTTCNPAGLPTPVSAQSPRRDRGRRAALRPIQSAEIGRLTASQLYTPGKKKPCSCRAFHLLFLSRFWLVIACLFYLLSLYGFIIRHSPDKINILKRMRALYSPLGNNPIQFFRLELTHKGIFIAIFHFITVHIRVFHPLFFDILKNRSLHT